MTEDLLNLTAIVFEIGLPVVIGVICLIKPNHRKWLVPVLGAVTPLLIVYAHYIVGYYFVSREEFEYGFLVMWVMSFFIYCLMVATGFMVAISLRNKFNNYILYFIGFLAGPSVTVIFLWIEKSF